MRKGNWIEHKGEEIALDSTINFEFYSPFTDNTEVVLGTESVNPRGNYSLPFTIENNPQFDRIMSGLHLISKNNRVYRLDDVTLFSDGVRIDIGFLEIKNIVHNNNTGLNKWSCTIFFGQTDFADKIKGKKVNELLMFGIKNIPAGRAKAFKQGLFTDTTLSEINIRSFNPTIGAGANNGRITYGEQDDWEGQNEMHLPSDPFPYEQTWATNVWAAEVINGLHDAEYICFPTFAALNQSLNPTDSETIVDANVRICNWWQTYANRFYAYNRSRVNISAAAGDIIADGSGLVSFVDNMTSYNTPIVPCFFYHQVLRHIFKEHGYTLMPDAFIDSVQFKRLYLLNTFNISKEITFNTTNLWVSPGDESRNFNHLIMQDDTELNPKNHLPETTIEDFLKDFQFHYGCRFIFSGKNVFIEYIDIENPYEKIDEIHPEIETEPTNNESGINIKYELSDDSYNRYSTFDLVQEYKGGSKEYTLLYPPAANRNIEYLLPLRMPKDGSSYWVNRLGDKVYTFGVPLYLYIAHPIIKVPFVMQTVTGKQPSIFTWNWIDNTYFVPGDNATWDKFVLTGSEETEDVPNSYIACAFYYGKYNHGTINESLPPNSYIFENILPTSSSENVLGATIMADWDLGITTSGGVVKKFFRTAFLKVMEAPEKIIINPVRDIYQILNHRWSKSAIINGVSMYSGAIFFEAPLKDLPKYECYRTE